MAKKLSELYSPKSQAGKNFVAKHKTDIADNIYAPKSPGAKGWVNKLTVKHNTDKSPATSNDNLFKGGNIKTIDRTAKRMGYNPGDDEKVYGVGGTIPGQNDQAPPPATGSTLYPSGKFTKESIKLTDEEIDDLLDMLGEMISEKMIDEAKGED